MLAAFATLGTVAAISVGSVNTAPADIWSSLFSGPDSLSRDLVLNLRLPRALTALHHWRNHGTGRRADAGPAP